MAGWTVSTEAWIWMGVWAFVLILATWLLVREPRRDAPSDPAAILRSRFARGEISEWELRRAMRAIGELSDASSGPAAAAPRTRIPGQETHDD